MDIEGLMYEILARWHGRIPNRMTIVVVVAGCVPKRYYERLQQNIIAGEMHQDNVCHRKMIILPMGFHPKSSILTHMRDFLCSSYARLTYFLDMT